MNNYANWELTQLLPEINPYQQDNGETMYFSWIDFEGKLAVDSHSSIRFYANGKILRDAWNFEDIRLYLLSQEIEFFMDTYYGYDKKQYYFVAEIGKYGTDIYEYYDSEVHDWLFDDYEQAREEAIKYCLTKIKNG